MNRSDVLSTLGALKPDLIAQFGVADLVLFGSAARDDLRPDSDIDVLVAFDGPATARRFFGVQFALEDAFGWAIDLVTTEALRPEMRPYLERDALHV